MNYTRKIDTDKAVEVQISSFTGKGGTTEYQVMVSITDPCLSFVEQLQNLLRVYVTVVKEELSNDATAVFRRYFLSDAANQTDSVMEWECESAFCPLSIVQQPPLNGTKIAMWTYLQTASRYILSERFYWSQLWTPVLPSYTEVGYGIGNHIFNIGIFAGFDRWHYQSMGFKFAFELFQ